MTGPLKAYHAEFLQTLMADYSGEKLTKVTKAEDSLKFMTTTIWYQVLDFVKTLSEEVLDKLIKEVCCVYLTVRPTYCFLIFKLPSPGRAQGVLRGRIPL